jgi:hypothetical protein
MPATYKDNGGSVNGSNKVFTYDFPTLQTEDVKVALNGVTQATTKYTVSLSPANITFNNTSVDSSVQETDGSPKSGVTVKVYRETVVGKANGDEDPKAVFAAGSSIRAGDLNANVEQALFAIHELQEQEVQTESVASGAVTSAKIEDGTIVNADVNASAAIAGTKVSPAFGSQNISTSGSASTGALGVTGNITVSGTVDGRDLQTDGSKLDGIEAGATADQTASEIRSLIGSASDSNVLSDALKSKLDAIEASATADQTAAEIRTLVESASDSNVFTDADHSKLNAIEASATADQTASEIRTLVESASDSNVFTDADHTKLNNIEASADVTDATNVDAAGAVMNSDLDGKGEILVGDGSGDPTALAASTTNGHILTIDTTEATGMKWAANAGSGGGGGSSLTVLDESTTLTADATKFTFTGAGVTATEPSSDEITITIPGTNTQLTQEQVEDFVGGMLDGTETGITVTYDDTDGNIDFVVASQTDENFTTADHSKLDGIEASATADQTDAEIRAAVEAASDSNVFTDADHTKLNGIATSANAYVHPNHSGEVTSTADGATVIASDIVDEDNLKISNAGSNGQFLQKQSGNTGGLTWASVSGTITALNNQTANRLTTIGSTTTELDGEASLTFEDTTSTGLISGKQITGRGFECPATVSDDWTIAAGNNAFFPGPMTVAANKTVTVPASRTLTIV